MITLDDPSSDCDLIPSIFSRDEIASSTFFVTEFSTSDGEAPGYEVLIVIIDLVIFG
jgi:hypothetical protein